MKSSVLITGAALACATLTTITSCGIAARARLNTTWPDVEGKDLQIPTPLSEAELESWRAELRAQEINHAGEALAFTMVGDVRGETESTSEVSEGERMEEAPVRKEWSDPLEGADLEAEALRRAIERGQHLSEVRLGCADCHGADYGGDLVADAMPVWRWYAPNITKGGLTKDYTAADWDRIIRHGVKPDGTNATMPAIDYQRLSDREVSDVAAFIESRPAVETVQPPTKLGPIGKALMAFKKMPLSAEMIDHSLASVALPPEEAVSVDFGEHIVQTCVGCHGGDFAGGPIAGGPPDWPPASNLRHTEAGLLGWTEANFITAMREGTRPDGSAINPIMPWEMLGKLSDTELKAMWVYLSGLSDGESADE